MHIGIKFGTLVSALFLLAACETPPQDGSGAGGSGGANGANGGYGTGGDSHMLAEGVGDRVFFAFDSSVLTSEGQATLGRQASWLKQHGDVKVVVEGHCDERGTREYNLALGERRASAAKRYLASLGVPAARVSTVSYGKERPAVAGSDEAAWAQNRRAVTVLAH